MRIGYLLHIKVLRLYKLGIKAKHAALPIHYKRAMPKHALVFQSLYNYFGAYAIVVAKAYAHFISSFHSV
jgi:hypothetical protein